MEDSSANIPDLPDGIKRSSALAAKQGSTTSLRSAESTCCVRFQLNQHIDEIISVATGRGRFQFERQMLADISVALGVSKKRFLIERIEPMKGWRQHTIVDLLVIPDEDGSPPTCGILANLIVDEVNKGSLNTMPSMRRAVKAELQDKDTTQQASCRPTKETEGELKFSMLRGGIFFDSKHCSVGQGGEDSSQAAHGSLQAETGLDPEELRLALAQQERELAAARRQKDERRSSFRTFRLWHRLES